MFFIFSIINSIFFTIVYFFDHIIFHIQWFGCRCS